jgi:hypothetical protein
MRLRSSAGTSKRVCVRRNGGGFNISRSAAEACVLSSTEKVDSTMSRDELQSVDSTLMSTTTLNDCDGVVLAVVSVVDTTTGMVGSSSVQ